MPASLPLLHTGLGVTAAIALIAIAASFLTLIASTFLLWRYRKTIARLMSAHAGGGDERVASGAQSNRDASLSGDSDAVEPAPLFHSRRNDLAECLYRRTKSGLRRDACKYAIAGGLFALLVGTAGFFAFSQTQVNSLRAADHPLQFLLLVWTLAWPIVLTTNIVTAARRRNQWLNVLIYFVILVVLGGLLSLTATEVSFQADNVSLSPWSGETPLRLVFKWGLFNFTPTLLIVIFRNSRVRAVAPLVLSFMTVVSAGALTMIAAAFVYRELSVATIVSISHALGVSVFAALIGYFLLICTAACVLSGVLGWFLLAWIRSGYQRRLLSDQSLAIDALWLIFASFYAVILASAGPGWALSPLVAFVVYKVAVRIGNKRRRQQSGSPDYDPALLVLRVFALGKRSEILFDALTQRWRHVGSVKLIAGTDLALSTVAPHQFLAFVSGKITQLFVRSDAAIDGGLAVLDQGRDADGRFRINDFFCHADTWQGVLKKLIKHCDVVLMDLRDLTEANAGCVFEIRELLNAVPLERLVFVVDETTDKNFLKQTLQETCRVLSPDSPNVGLSWSALQPFELDSAGYHEIQSLIRRICAAVRFRPARLSPT